MNGGTETNLGVSVLRDGTSLTRPPADDTVERINLLYDLLVPGLSVVQVAALDELRDTALTLHAALRREALPSNIGTGS